MVEFQFNCQKELGCNSEGFSVLEVGHLVNGDYENSELVLQVISKLRSEYERDINKSIKPLSSFDPSSKIYLKCWNEKAFGFLIINKQNQQKAVLHEFYVFRPFQRFGHGRSIYEKMLKIEGIEPINIDVGQPTHAFSRFMESLTLKKRGTLSSVGQIFMNNGTETPNAMEKKNAFSGLRPRPNFIPDTFQRRHQLFFGEFVNNSTNPSKFDPTKKDYDFKLDFSTVRQNRLNNLSAKNSDRNYISSNQEINPQTSAKEAYYSSRNHNQSSNRLAESLQSLDQLKRAEAIEEIKKSSPKKTKIGRAPIAKIQPQTLDHVASVPMAPFGTMNNESAADTYYFRSGDKLNYCQI